MQLDCDSGRELASKYLAGERLAKRLEHSFGVGDFAYSLASRVQGRNPELQLDPQLVGFLGYAHDIGYSVADAKHEVHTVHLLLHEGLPFSIARMAMHGQLAEQFGAKEGNVGQYLPVGVEGMILTYADMSVRTGGPIPMDERAAEIISRVTANASMPDALKQDIITNLQAALPRFRRYEGIVLALAGASKEFAHAP